MKEVSLVIVLTVSANITPSASADDLDHIIDLSAVLSRHTAADSSQRSEEQQEEESPFMNKVSVKVDYVLKLQIRRSCGRQTYILVD